MSTQKQLLILPIAKRFDKAQTDMLADAGFIVVYMKDPSQARLINAEPSPVNGNAMLLAALKAVRAADSYGSYREFVEQLIRAAQSSQAAP